VVILASRIGSWLTLASVVIVKSLGEVSTPMDWTIVLVAAIAAVPGTLAAYAAMRAAKGVGSKVEKAAAKADDTRVLVEKIEISINSRMTALLERTDEAARLAGMAAERLVGAARAADTATATASITAEKAAVDQAAAEARHPEGAS
jgi:hypothetical protein